MSKYINESEKSNETSIRTSKLTNNVDDNYSDILKPMWVKGDRSDRTRTNDLKAWGSIGLDPFLTTPIALLNSNNRYKENTIIVDEMQSFNFSLIANDREVAKQYKNDSNVWILSHGYNDKFGGDFEKIGNDILRDDPSAIILGLDWSNIANKDINPVASGSYDMCRVPTWIRPISQVIHKRLSNWGFKDSKKLKMVGHSLGTIMVSEISQRFMDENGQKADKLILLDPPSETRCKIRGNQYTVQTIPEIPKVQQFSRRADYTYSFVGNHSLAGNEEMAITAHKSYWMEYGNLTDFGNEHTAVVATFEKINRSDKLTDLNQKPEGYLSILDKDKHEDFESKSDSQNGSDSALCKLRNCYTGQPAKAPDGDEWKDHSWKGHYGVLEAGNDTNVDDGDFQWLWVKKEGIVIKKTK
ncbi:MAG: hypothetical protein ACRCXZ_01035 [Patescibacteria group bacterium]